MQTHLNPCSNDKQSKSQSEDSICIRSSLQVQNVNMPPRMTRVLSVLANDATTVWQQHVRQLTKSK